MNIEDVANLIKAAKGKLKPVGPVSPYIIQTIEGSQRNYSIHKLCEYLSAFGLCLVIKDLATEDTFKVKNVMDVHRAISLLMKRYQKSEEDIYRMTTKWYRVPRKWNTETSPLSIRTLLSVCSVLHCNLIFEKAD